MIVAIHQPEHMPWLGFFDKMNKADVFVLLDDVQFAKNNWQNRNRIRGDRSPIWVTVPVLTKGKFRQSIGEVSIDNRNGSRWKEKCWLTIRQHYNKSKYWDDHVEFFKSIYSNNWENLLLLNEEILTYLSKCLGIDEKICKSSEMDAVGSNSNLLLSICKELDADTYISGISGKDYLDMESFNDAGINVEFQEFYHPIYHQLYEPFIPGLSVIDLLLNYGPDSMNVIQGLGVAHEQFLFE